MAVAAVDSTGDPISAVRQVLSLKPWACRMDRVASSGRHPALADLGQYWVVRPAPFGWHLDPVTPLLGAFDHRAVVAMVHSRM